jgi:hypothetical protein
MVRLPRLFSGMSIQGYVPRRGDRPPVGRCAGPGLSAPGQWRSGQTSVQSSDYWSATTNANDATNAWNVNFNDGNVNNDDKSNDNYA